MRKAGLLCGRDTFPITRRGGSPLWTRRLCPTRPRRDRALPGHERPAPTPAITRDPPLPLSSRETRPYDLPFHNPYLFIRQPIQHIDQLVNFALPPNGAAARHGNGIRFQRRPKYPGAGDNPEFFGNRPPVGLVSSICFRGQALV